MTTPGETDTPRATHPDLVGDPDRWTVGDTPVSLREEGPTRCSHGGPYTPRVFWDAKTPIR